MCGIIGYIGNREATDVLIDGLKRLEYRGYDSAGIAVLNGHGIEVERAEGKLSHLEAKIHKHKPKGHIGIGHTRWATHGVPSERNAHPHHVEDVVVVHNGIIENYSQLRKELIQKGCHFKSETDTEIFCHLINEELKKTKEIQKAIANALKKVRGAYAIVVLYAKEPHKLYVAKLGSPLVLGFGKKENFVASDVPALLPYTREVAYLEDGEFAVVSDGSLNVVDSHGHPVTKKKTHIAWDALMAEKGGYKHFMLKEIFEQPRVVEQTIMGRIQLGSTQLTLEGIPKLFGATGFPFKQVAILACGTSWHAGMVAKYWFEQLARVPTTVHLASEFRYANPLIDSKTLVISISQSGETADTLAATQLAKQKKAKVLAICNVLGSSLTRASNATLYTHAGPEIGVASTKAFVSQMTVLYLLTLEMASRKKIMSKEELLTKMEEIRKLPQNLETVLQKADAIKKIAKECVNASHFLFIARGLQYPVALEGALKLKEISYVHAEGFAAGELKHGPIALVDKGVPVVALIPPSETYEKILSNVEEVKARGAFVIAVGEKGDEELEEKADAVIGLPKTVYSLTPILYAVPLQLFAYYIADFKGTDVDQPRNLAKSVTVE
ncbi:MAG: glutamine--fructose-6-phosphate transaminase (isomerizing) [Deltaproteobacteria bacterium]|nr:glutamine--fructose-6-phosphate transaminase (isomerizing) [Deltaproteobacteria bacterium]